MKSTLERLNYVFREVFDEEDLVVTPETTADDIREWDSLMHVTLVTCVEREFGIKFTSSQVALLMDVGDLLGLIEKLADSAQPQPER